MKKIRTNEGILFLGEEDYMPRLIAYLRDTAGEDAASLVEEWAKAEQNKYVEAMARAEAQASEATARALRLFDEMRDERDEHLAEIDELEGELTALAEFKDKLLDANEYMLGLIRNPEKLFPAIGTRVWAESEEATVYGTMDAVKLRKHRGGHAFFFRVKWDNRAGAWYKFPAYGAKASGKILGIHFGTEEDVRV